jgi:curli production assembly/transport component CsgF
VTQHRGTLAAGALALGLTAAGAAHAQQLSYTPINPSFGGNPFNSSHLLALANAQNQFQPKQTETTETQAQLFASQLEGQLLSALASQVTNAIFGDNPQQSGTISFGGQTITFNRGLDNVTINITDTSGKTTQIVVPTFVKVD